MTLIKPQHRWRNYASYEAILWWKCLSYHKDQLTKWSLRAIESYQWNSTPISVRFLVSLELISSTVEQTWLHPSKVHWYKGMSSHITINTSMITKSHKHNQALVLSTLPSFQPEYTLYCATYWWFGSCTHDGNSYNCIKCHVVLNEIWQSGMKILTMTCTVCTMMQTNILLLSNGTVVVKMESNSLPCSQRNTKMCIFWWNIHFLHLHRHTRVRSQHVFLENKLTVLVWELSANRMKFHEKKNVTYAPWLNLQCNQLHVELETFE